MNRLLYGIKNCDRCRDARRWLDAQGIPYRFHDLRDDGLSRDTLQTWLKAASWEQLLNRRSTTWRSLSEADQSCDSEASALELMFTHPTLVKRPVLVGPEGITIGFSIQRYEVLFSGAT